MKPGNPFPCKRCGARATHQVRWIKTATSGLIDACQRCADGVAFELIFRPQVLRIAVTRRWMW
jgi:hypothetical protein